MKITSGSRFYEVAASDIFIPEVKKYAREKRT